MNNDKVECANLPLVNGLETFGIFDELNNYILLGTIALSEARSIKLFLNLKLGANCNDTDSCAIWDKLDTKEYKCLNLIISSKENECN